MTGGFLQLVAKSYDDLYLTTFPQITLFKLVYRRCINFSFYDDDILIKSGGNFASKTSIKLEKKADLLHKMYVVVDLPDIKISKTSPTHASVRQLLATYGVEWLNNSTEIVTMDDYQSIIDVINAKITELIENYNQVNSGLIFLDLVSDSILEPLINVDGLSDTDYDTITEILLNGRNCFNELLYLLTSSYSTDYRINSINDILESGSDQTITYPTTKSLSLYSLDTIKQSEIQGALMGTLGAYSKDALMYNANYEYFNSGTILVGELCDVSLNYGTINQNILTNVTISNANISGSTIISGTVVAQFLDQSMSAHLSTITNVNLINVTIYTDTNETLTNYFIENATLIYVNVNSQNITGTITNGTLFPNTINDIIITNAVFNVLTINDGTIDVINQNSIIENNNEILLPSVTLISSDGIQTSKTLYDCTLSGIDIQANEVVNRSVISASVATVVIDTCDITNAIINDGIISGKLKNGTLIKNNFEIINNITTITNAILLNCSIVEGNLTIFYNITHAILSNISVSDTNIVCNVSEGRINQNFMTDAIISNCTFATQTLTDMNTGNGRILNYPINEIDIENGIINDTNGINFTLIDETQLKYTNIKLNNLSLTYGSIQKATLIDNDQNMISIVDNVLNSADNHISTPLFGSTLKKQSIVTNCDDYSIYPNLKFKNKLNLYNADDFRCLTYLTYLNNIIRIKVDNVVEFDPCYSVLQNSTISEQNINLLTPQLLSLDSSILFIHSLDPITTNYDFFNAVQLGSYFNKYINARYEIANKYSNLISLKYSSYEKSDAFMIYTKFLQSTNPNVRSIEHIQYLANLLMSHIDANLRYNFLQLYQILSVIANGKRGNTNSFIQAFNKKTNQTGFTPNDANDNFLSVLLNVVPIQYSGTHIENYFNTYITTKFKEFKSMCEEYLESTDYKDYYNNSLLWEMNTFQINSDLYNIYSLVTGESLSATYASLSVSAFIPFVACRDIARMMYDAFEIYFDYIFQPYLDSLVNIESIEYINFKSEFLSELEKYIDAEGRIAQSDSDNAYVTKVQLYEKIIYSTFKYENTFLNDEYFQNIKDQGYSHTFVFRPERLMCQSSTIDNSGNLIDVNSEYLKYLPIEWLTQTYYNIFCSVTNLIVENSDQSMWNDALTLKLTLNGISANIVNCFIAHNKLPPLSDYINNKYWLLGLLDETNSVLNDYTRDLIVNINRNVPSYCDAIQSITHQAQKRSIQLYNQLFNDTLFSKSYYQNYLGSAMSNLFDYIKEQFEVQNQLNTYYQKNYPNLIPVTLQSDITTDLFIAVPNIGFDIYTLDISGSYINTFISDFATLYNFTFSNYCKCRQILSVINDTTSLMLNERFENGMPDYSNWKLIEKSNFVHSQSQIINNYIYQHVSTKYINPIQSTLIKTTLDNLASNTMNYWIPTFDTSGNITNNGKMGILDMLYIIDPSGSFLNYDSSGMIYLGSSVSGNLSNEINKLSIVPSGYLSSDYIAQNINPFDSYFLHEWYRALAQKGKTKYQTLIDATELFNNIANNLKININELDASLFASTVMFDSVGTPMRELVIANDFDRTKNLIRTNLTNRITKLIDDLKNITKFVDQTLITTTYNEYHQYIDVSEGNDVYYYSQSNLLNTTLETSLIDLIEYTNAKFAWVKELGNKLISNISLKIGGEIIDSYSSKLAYFINKMNTSSNQKRGYDIMIGNTHELYEYASNQRLQKRLYIPINFSFNKHAGNALPLLCLLYSEVELVIEMSDYLDVIVIEQDAHFVKIPKLKTKLYAQYILLDEEERMRVAQSRLEYLIESYNSSGARIYSNKTLSSKVDAQIISRNKEHVMDDIAKGKQVSNIIEYDVRLSDSIKYLIWCVKIIDTKTQLPLDLLDWNKFGYRVRDASGNLTEYQTIFSSISIQMNGTDRETPKNEYCYSYVFPHSKNTTSFDSGEYFYSFAIYPSLLQPSGTANYTELNNSTIRMVLADNILEIIKTNPHIEITVELWGCAYKILRIMSGFGALAFYK